MMMMAMTVVMLNRNERERERLFWGGGMEGVTVPMNFGGREGVFVGERERER